MQKPFSSADGVYRYSDDEKTVRKVKKLFYFSFCAEYGSL